MVPWAGTVAVMERNEATPTVPAGQQMRAWRQAQEPTVSQETLGKLLGCTRVYVSQLESGYSTPSLALAVTIEQLTGIPPRDW